MREEGVRLRVLGEVQVVGPSGPVPLGGRRQRLLLAELLANVGQVVGLGTLIEAVWPGEDVPAEPERTVRVYVTRLRKVFALAGLEQSTLVTSDGGYLLQAGATVYDAEAFVALTNEARRIDQPLEKSVELLERALALWNGPAFGELAGEHSLLSQAQHLEELRLETYEQRATVRLALGDSALVVAELEQLVARHPLRERLRRLLMEALARGGRTAEALRVLADYRRLLRTELGLEPSAELCAVEAALLAPESPVEDAAPHRFVRGYRLFERIGEGAFSVVYRARQASVGRDVAVKIIRAELADLPDFIRRFEAEAQLVARLEHPNIVPLYDFWREPARAYLVMRWLRAGSLEAQLDRGPWPLDRTTRMVVDVGAALSSAHRVGVIHRDVRPANILLDDEGNAYLSDFGIALTPNDAAAAYPALSPGSPAYAAPEQLTGHVVGPPGDVYGLAMTVFESLAGRPAHAEANDAADLRRRQLTEQIPRLHAFCPDAPDAVDDVLAMATAKSPEDRYQSVDEFVFAFCTAVAPMVGVATTNREQHRNPYRGLLPFHEADATMFFGRDELISELVAHLRHHGVGRCLAVIGASGSGKSSVIRAGLIPALRRGRVTGSDRWFVAECKPGTDPYASLAESLLRLTTTQHVDVLQRLTADASGIVSTTNAMLPAGSSELVLVIDQFEELFTSADPASCDCFLDSLACAVTQPGSRVRVVITLRSDYLDRVMLHQGFGQVLRNSVRMIPPLAPSEIEQAIVNPARKAGVRIQDGLVAEMVAEVTNRPAVLPLLQFALHQLYERQQDGMLTIRAYRELGGVTGALAERAEDLVHGDAGRIELARRLFRRLVGVGADSEEARRRALRSELAPDGGPTGALIDAFGDARLLSFDRDPATRAPTVEIAHEALLSQWPRLAAWISEDRDGVRVLRQIAEAAVAWDDRNRDPVELYRGGRLDDALNWRSAHDLDLNNLEHAFLAAGEAQRDRARAAELKSIELSERTNRRLGRLLATVATVAALAVLAGTVAAQQRSHAVRSTRLATSRAAEAMLVGSRSETRRLGVEAATRARNNPQLALLLATEAYRRDPGAESLGALQRALTGTGNFLGVESAGRRTNKVDWLDDHRIAVAGADGVYVQDLLTNRITTDYPTLSVASLPIVGDGTRAVIPLAAFSADRAAVTPTGSPKEVRIVRLDHVDTMVVRLSNVDAVQGIAFSPDGTAIATIDVGGQVSLFDVMTGRLRWRVAAHPEFVNSQLTLPPGLAASPERECDCISSMLHLVGFASDGSIFSMNGPVLRTWQADSGRRAGPEHILADATPRGRFEWSDSFHVAMDRGRLVVAGRARIGMFALATGQQFGTAASVAPADVHGGPWVADLATAPDSTIVILTTGGQIVRFDESTLRQVGTALDVHLRDAVDFAVSPRGDRVAVATGEGVGLWSLRGDSLLARAAPRSDTTVATLSPDGNSLTAFQGDELLPAPRPVIHVDLSGPDPRERALPEISATYRYLDQSPLLYNSTPTGKVTSWNPFTLRQVASYDIGPWWTSEAVSADGEWIVFGFPGLRTYDTKTGAPVALFTSVGGYSRSLSFSPDKKRLAVADADDSQARVFDVATQQLVDEIDPNGPHIVAVRYSTDGTTLATIDDTGRISLRDPDNFAIRRSLAGNYEGAVSDSPLWFSDDGRLLLSGSARQAQLWDLESGIQIGDPFPNDADFKLDGNDGPHLVTAVEDHLLVWNLHVDQWPSIACRAAGRNLTAAEWTLFGPSDTAYHATCPDWPSLE